MTNKPANRTDVINHVASQIDLEEAGLTVEDLTELFDMFLSSIVQLSDQRPYVQIREFGRFEQRMRAERVNKKPIRGGKPTTVPAHKVLWFTASPGLARVV